MKAVILAGGMGTRISEETTIKPKPMIEVGSKPILWHIMKIYSFYGINEFIICLGYKGYIIKEYFANYLRHNADLTIDLSTNETKIHSVKSEPWKVTLVDTGDASMTGGRIKRIEPFIEGEPFMLTYGDGLSNVNIKELYSFHQKSGKFLTVTSVQPPGRFGALEIDNDNYVSSFMEKPKGDGAWINGGFFVCQPEIFDYITEGDSTVWEKSPMENLARDNRMAAFRHTGFWKPMDTLRDKEELEKLWSSGQAPWKIW